MTYRLPRVTTQRRRRPSVAPFYLVGGVVVLVMVACIVLAVLQNNTRNTMTCTVTGKDMATQVTAKNQSQTIYQVETEQCGVIRAQDNLWQGVWNSADLYAQLHPGRTYEITTIGWRIPWASQFPTIVKVSAK